MIFGPVTPIRKKHNPPIPLTMHAYASKQNPALEKNRAATAKYLIDLIFKTMKFVVAA